jgi:hypothetical protein
MSYDPSRWILLSYHLRIRMANVIRIEFVSP